MHVSSAHSMECDSCIGSLTLILLEIAKGKQNFLLIVYFTAYYVFIYRILSLFDYLYLKQSRFRQDFC